MFFSRRVYLFVEQTCSFQEVYMFFEQAQIFQKGLSNRHVFFKEVLFVPSNKPYYLIGQILIVPETLIISPRTHTNFPGASIFSSNRYQFSRNLYFFIEQIFIFQEALSSPRIHTNFQETPMSQTNRHFPGRYPPSNRYLLIGLSGCFLFMGFCFNGNCLFLFLYF